MTRRSILASPALAAAVPAPEPPYWTISSSLIDRHDASVDTLIRAQISDPANRWHGGLADSDGLFSTGPVAGMASNLGTALVYPKSRHFQSGAVLERLKLALDFVKRKSTPEGYMDLQFTNFHSPPDTAFAMYGLCSAAHIARQFGAKEIEALLEPAVKLAAGGLAKGGVHTPNHRWVMCAALAQALALYPDPSYLKRIEEWLAETIDIDADGQYSERSSLMYNGVVDKALTVTAIKLKRWELLEPVRKNLAAMLYLLHPGNEVVTEISRRQDLNQRGIMTGWYWMPLRYMAVKDGNGAWETLARLSGGSLMEYLEYPELTAAGPAPAPVPEDYEKPFPALNLARIRRGPTSATILLGGASRFFTLRRGAAVIGAVRIASPFFGRGQFVPSRGEKKDGSYVVSQSLDAGYYQPLHRKQPVGVEDWYALRELRERTQICTLETTATITETATGFRLRVQVSGTDDVPVVIEIGLLGEGKLEGCEPAKSVPDAWHLGGAQATWQVGGDQIRFGPGRREHNYITVRGAEPKLPMKSVYLTGFAPFDHTVEFSW